jgi:hypothetical protein
VQPDLATPVVAQANSHLEASLRILSVEEKQAMDIKAEIAKKLARGELASDSYLKRHRTGVERVIGHTAIGDFHTELVASQEGSESWTVIVSVKNKPEVCAEASAGGTNRTDDEALGYQ